MIAKLYYKSVAITNSTVKFIIKKMTKESILPY